VIHPSEEDRWQRSKDLVNSEVLRVRTQTLDTLSHEYTSSEKEDNRWIQITGGPLDPHEGSCVRVS
jgi:hypothetical protein